MKTVEKNIKILNDLGYLVQNVWQDTLGWTFVFRSPFNHHWVTVQGKTLAVAADNARQRAQSLGAAIDTRQHYYAACRARYRRKNRVKLKRKRIRL